MLTFFERRSASKLAVIALASALSAVWVACSSTVVVDHGSGGSGGGTATGGSGGTATTSNGGSPGTGGSSTTVGSSSSTGQGGDASCTGVECGIDLKCCGGACVATYNDFNNCGSCGNKCGGAHPFCDQGVCADAPPCAGGPVCDPPGYCCGATCCGPGQICCDVPEGVDSGPHCVDPDNGTCPQGCPACL